MMKILTENNVVVSYQIVGGGYTPNENQVVYEVDEIPEEVQNADIGAFCYSEEKGFYENPDYVPPDVSPTTEELTKENELMKAQIQAQSDQMDFYEECIIEMAEIVYA